MSGPDRTKGTGPDTPRARTPRATDADRAQAERAKGSIEAVNRQLTIDPELRRRMIETTAYFRAERRGFRAGSEMVDWVEAEAEVERMLQLGVESEPQGKKDNKRAFVKKLEAQLADFDTRVEHLKAKAKDAQVEVLAEYKEQLRALGEKRALAQDRLKDLSERADLALDDLKVGVDKAWDDMRQAMESIASRFK